VALRIARSTRSLLALGLVSLIGLVHCSSASPRSGFAEPEQPKKSTVATEPSDSDDDDDTGGFNASNAPPPGDDSECTQDIDVVLVLDVSSSMGFVLTTLGNDISGVVDAANKLKAGAHFGIVGFSDNGAFGLGGSDAEGKVHTKASTLKKAFSDFKSIYMDHDRNPGDGPNGPTQQNPICEENSLDALYMAAAEFPWRDNAARVIILATDDTFLEAPDNYGDRDGDGKEDKTDFPREGDYPALHTVKDTVAAVKAAKARVFTVTRLKPPGLLSGAKCGTSRRHTGDDNSIAYGWSKPYDGQAPIPQQTDGKNFDLAEVQSNKLDLADTINGIVLETHCAGDPPK
jgi:hypothetical protein